MNRSRSVRFKTPSILLLPPLPILHLPRQNLPRPHSLLLKPSRFRHNLLQEPINPHPTHYIIITIHLPILQLLPSVDKPHVSLEISLSVESLEGTGTAWLRTVKVCGCRAGAGA